MVPRISVRRQRRYGLPVAIERLRGRQYRCLRCNTVFYELDELDHHLKSESPGPDAEGAPRFDDAILIRIFYSEDIREGWGEHLRDRDDKRRRRPPAAAQGRRAKGKGHRGGFRRDKPPAPTS